MKNMPYSVLFVPIVRHCKVKRITIGLLFAMLVLGINNLKTKEKVPVPKNKGSVYSVVILSMCLFASVIFMLDTARAYVDQAMRSLFYLKVFLCCTPIMTTFTIQLIHLLSRGLP